MSGRELIDDEAGTWYVLVEQLRDRALAELAVGSILDVMRPRIARAVIDAVTDFSKGRPPEVDIVEENLERLSARQRKGQRIFRRPSRSMNVELDATHERDWWLLRTYAAWSINVDLYDADGEDIATFHDCGFEITVKLRADETARLVPLLGPQLHMEPYQESRARTR